VEERGSLMRSVRGFAFLVVVLLPVVVAVACSAVDPEPPHPHLIDGDPDIAFLMQDAGTDGATEAGP
jgi:hypothetical protein